MTNNRDELMRQIAAKSGATGDYTYEEKLAAVAAELMDPKEVGLVSAEEAKLKLLPPEQQEVKFGDMVEFVAGVVPLVLRAQWELSETKIVLAPADKDAWIKNWITEHKNDYLIQGKMHCGSALAQFERSYKDPILGLAAMLRLCGDMLEKKYLGEELPPSTEPKIEKRDAQTNESTEPTK